MNKGRILTLATLLVSPLATLNAADSKPLRTRAPVQKGADETGVTPRSKGEPTNAKEAADKKGAATAAIDAKYAELVAKLPPEEQAWERTLQANLGGFYLPLYKAGRVKGSEQAWDYVRDVPGLPRVLLIGDSVSRGYTLAARKALSGKANVHRAPENCGPSANGLKKLDVWLAGEKWDVLHFNFGIHDRATPPDVYRQRLETLVTRMKATGAKVIWASTTPVPPDTKDGPKASGAIVERNRIAAEVMARHGVAINDLFAFITLHLSRVQNPKDVHFKGEGYDLLGKQVAEAIAAALK
ncbi:MAG: SGNH/GDSL hydrolase family protein [Kiritimatiellia bacterium]|jgi:lysophospholipase L1-like esterase|nr:SGNH/GDSL hydrolase family protein [Kiritimatiellia bacterium]